MIHTQDEIEEVYVELLRRDIRSSLIEKDGVLLKLECSLPTGSYKIRGVVSYFLKDAHRTQRTLSVLSAGNLALAAAQECKKFGIQCEAIVPQGISEAKRKGLIDLDAKISEMPFSSIWDLVEDTEKHAEPGFLHPFHQDLLLGYATIAAELATQTKEIGAIVVPYGLGGLCCSVIEGLRQLGMQIPVYACEIQGYAPLSRARTAGRPVRGEKLNSFIEALGTPVVLDDAFDEISHQIAGVVDVTEKEVRKALLQLNKDGIQVEGAAAAAYASALKLRDVGNKNVVALITGRNISESILKEVTSYENRHC